MPFLLSFGYFEPVKGFFNSYPLQGIHMHTNSAIHPELSCGFDLPGNSVLPSFLPQMENLDTLLAILHSSNLLLSLQGVQQPCEDPLVDSSFNYRTQRVLFSSVPVCTISQCPPGRVSSSQNVQQFCPLVHPMHPLNAHLAELSESSVILVLSKLTAEFFSMHHCAYAQCPLGRASQNSSELLSATVFFSHSLASKVFSNLEVFLLSC
jgi:hypothetical protein